MQEEHDEGGGGGSGGSGPGTRDLSCGLCEDKKTFTSRSYLFGHYSTSHFSDKLKKFAKDKKCTLCGQEFKQPQALQRHLGSVHDLVDEYLDSSLHRPKARGQKVNKGEDGEPEPVGKLEALQMPYFPKYQRFINSGININNLLTGSNLTRTNGSDQPKSLLGQQINFQEK